MLHIILQILAVIGIILACILGFLLLILILVLFVPVRYQIRGSKDADAFELFVKVSYLLHIVSLSYDLPEPGKVIVKLFGIRIAVIPKEAVPEKDDKKRKKTSDISPQEEPRKAEAENKETETAAEPVAELKQAEYTKEQQEEKPEDETGADADSGFSAEEGEKQKKQGLFIKIKNSIYTIRKFCDRIKELWKNIAYYKELLTRTENKLFYKRVFDRLLRILKSIRPRVLSADLVIGTGSPDSTGYLMGLYGMLFPVLGNTVNITPDFDDSVWEGVFYAKGKITLFVLLRHAVSVALDKQLRALLKDLKREEL